MNATATKKTVTEVTLVLDGELADWLQVYLQNPMTGNEPTTCATARQAVCQALDNVRALKGAPVSPIYEACI